MKLIKMTSLGVVLSLIVTGTLSARPLDEIKTSGILKVGVPTDYDYVPLAFYDKDKNLVGFDIDIINDYAKAQNFNIEFVPTTWPMMDEDLTADKFDIVVGGLIHKIKREDNFLLTDPILHSGKIALAHCSVADQLNSFSKINQPTVTLVVSPAGTDEPFVNGSMDNAKIMRVKDDAESRNALRNKTADVMITDLIQGTYYENTEPGVLCMATKVPFNDTQSYKSYMMNKDDGKLLESFNEWLKNTDLKAYQNKWGI